MSGDWLTENYIKLLTVVRDIGDDGCQIGAINAPKLRLAVMARREIVQKLKDEGNHSQAEIAEITGVSEAIISQDVKKLKDQRDIDVHFSSATDEWSTPQDFFDQLNDEFHFDLDVCALPSSAKCTRYFSPDDDGLAQKWTGVCWMNPPYGDVIGKWIEKAYHSANDGTTVVCLVPARVDTGWWWDHCRYGEIRFLRGRLKFGGSNNSAPFPSAVVIFGVPSKVVWWEL